MRATPSLVSFVLIGSLFLSACADSESTQGGTTTTATSTETPTLNIPDDPDCDPLVPEVCGMPFPSSKWLAADSSRVTGYTLSFGPTTLPANQKGKHVDPAPYKRLDGYGVGVPAVAFFADLDGSDLPDETRIEESLTADARVMMFEVSGNVATRVPCFAEIDKAAKFDEERSLIVRPAVILKESTRYVVAIRGLKNWTVRRCRRVMRLSRFETNARPEHLWKIGWSALRRSFQHWKQRG
ncbi:MAG: hypothetical protein IPK82_43110 [Polyangiaceae bacterium]|nr:hypothetical protein [Polyangiaceae bacterium]